MEDFELQFEHIDWNEIVEAELSGDQDSLQRLRNKSMELRRSFSLPSPSSCHAPRTPPTPQLFKAPHQPRRPLASRSLNSPQPPSSSSPRCTYAQVACPRSMKRTVSERLGLSPVELPSKRQASSEVVVQPTEFTSPPPLVGHGQPLLSSSLIAITPQGEGEEVEVCTPDNDSRPVRTAVQRRLFPSGVQCGLVEERGLTDTHRLAQRQKQIEFGKNTIGYEKYIQEVPKWKRGKGDPVTPDKCDPCSTRSWQGRVRVWRRLLHRWDPPTGPALFTSEEAALCGMEELEALD